MYKPESILCSKGFASLLFPNNSVNFVKDFIGPQFNSSYLFILYQIQLWPEKTTDHWQCKIALWNYWSDGIGEVNIYDKNRCFMFYTCIKNSH